jgi:hypothetical protein
VKRMTKVKYYRSERLDVPIQRHPIPPNDSPFSAVHQLEDGDGFVFDLRPARRDPLAYKAIEKVFGSNNLSAIDETYHRSPLSYEALIEDLFEYDVVHKPRLDDDIYYLAVQTVRKDFQRSGKLIPLTLGGVIEHENFPNAKSPGLPWKTMGFKTKREAISDPEVNQYIREKWHRIGRGINTTLPDVCLFARAQTAKRGKSKIRATWGFGLEIYLEEGRFFYPVLEWLKTADHGVPIAYGLEMATGGMKAIHSMISRAKPGGRIMVTDWSKFDKTIPPWLMRDAFRILAELFDFGHVRTSDGKVCPVREDRSLRRWNKIVRYFIDTPVRTCKGKRYLVKGGLPSGSCFTNIIDTIVNMILTRYMTYQTTGLFPTAEIYLGDDAIIVQRGIINLEDMAVVAKEKFGVVLNVAKSYVTDRTDNAHFLGYFNLHGIPQKPQDFLIASFIWPEHTRRAPEETAAAALGQMWSSFSPYFAVKWYEVIKDVALYAGINFASVEDYMHTHPHRFKFISSIGLDPRTLTIPIPDAYNRIPEVQPPNMARKVIRLPDHNSRIRSLWSTVCEDLFFVEEVDTAEMTANPDTIDFDDSYDMTDIT